MRALCLLCISFWTCSVDELDAQEKATVQVKSVFFVPSDQQPPTNAEKQRLAKHLQLAQLRFREMLQGRDTFTITEDEADVYRSPNPLRDFEEAEQGGAREYTLELLAHYKVSQENCPYIFVIVLMNPTRNYPTAGGRPLNGGVNKGGGILILSSYGLNHSRNFQSTLQHELGHSFGLSHVNVYRYNMKTNPSIMSYNPTHHWDIFDPPRTQGVLIPEDLFVLAQNDKVFPQLNFDPQRDQPRGYQRRPPVYLGKLNLDVSGYELFLNGMRSKKKLCSFSNAVMTFLTDTKEHRDQQIVAKYKDVELIATGQGYELYWDYKRVGHEPGWTFSQGTANLIGNRKNHPHKKVHGFYNGNEIEFSGKGYELYIGDRRAGHEPKWSRQQAANNLRGNIRRHRGKRVVGLYNGQPLQP